MGRMVTGTVRSTVGTKAARSIQKAREDWEVALTTRLQTLTQLKAGWSGAESQPLNAASAEHFRAFLVHVPQARANDAYPVLTDEGYVRLEWQSHGHAYSAEIGPNSLYMCDLAPEAVDDSDVELDWYDQDRLVEFFLSGSKGDQ